MKIQYGIAGFLAGIMIGLLIGLAEMRFIRRYHIDTALPFIIGITVIASAITGIVVGVRMANRRLR